MGFLETEWTEWTSKQQANQREFRPKTYLLRREAEQRQLRGGERASRIHFAPSEQCHRKEELTLGPRVGFWVPKRVTSVYDINTNCFCLAISFFITENMPLLPLLSVGSWPHLFAPLLSNHGSHMTPQSNH